MRKIALFIPNLGGGGAEKVMVTLANYFIKKNYNVNLILLNKKGEYLDLLDEKIKIYDFKNIRALYSIPKLISYIKSEKPDVILSFLTHTNIAAIIAKIFSRDKNVKLFISERSVLSEAIKNTSSLILKNCKYFLKYLYRFPEKIIVISEGVGKDLEYLFKIKKEKIILIHNPYPLVEFIKQEIDEDKQIILNNIIKTLPKNSKVILSVGRLAKEKNHKLLIEAFEKLSFNNKILIILGEGPERDRLENQIINLNLKSKVFLPGFVANINSYYSKCDLFVLSSIYEGFGNVILEAMNNRVKIISTDCPYGPSEILENGKWGRLVPVNNAVLLAEAITEALCDDDNLDYSERLKDFSIEKIGKQYLKTMGY